MKKAFCIFHIVDGQVSQSGKRAIRKTFDSLQDGRHELTIERSNKRTGQQNKWIHAVLPDILQGLRDAGYNEIRDVNDAKDVVKALFFKRTISNGIEEIQVIEGTSETSKENFIEKADQIISWAKDYLGIDVAPPDKQLLMY